MASIVVSGDTSGAITLSAPAVAGATTLMLPATSGTAALTSDVIGVGQTWQNVTGSRATNTTYTNSTGKPIQIAVSIINTTSAATITMSVSGVTVATGYTSTVSNVSCMFFIIVPNGATYILNSTIGIVTWAELR